MLSKNRKWCHDLKICSKGLIYMYSTIENFIFFTTNIFCVIKGHKDFSWGFRDSAWVKVFRIIPKFRILRLTFHRKSASKFWNRQFRIAAIRFISIILKDNWPFTLEIANTTVLYGHTASYKIWISKVQDFENFELSPMILGLHILHQRKPCNWFLFSFITWHIYGDNCIQNFHLGRYIVGYMVTNLVLRRCASGAIKRDLRPYIRRYTSQMKNFKHGYPHSNALLQSWFKLMRCKLHKAAHHPIKCDVINDVKLFPTVYRRIYYCNFWTLFNQTSRYKSKCIRIVVNFSCGTVALHYWWS